MLLIATSCRHAISVARFVRSAISFPNSFLISSSESSVFKVMDMTIDSMNDKENNREKWNETSSQWIQSRAETCLGEFQCLQSLPTIVLPTGGEFSH